MCVHAYAREYVRNACRERIGTLHIRPLVTHIAVAQFIRSHRAHDTVRQDDTYHPFVVRRNTSHSRKNVKDIETVKEEEKRICPYLGQK